MAVDKKISELPDATLPISSGVKFEAIQGGVNVKVDADDMPGSGGGVTDGDKGDVVVSGSGAVWTVEAASESQAGKIEISTQAETNTGTDDVRAVTPLKLAAKLRLKRAPITANDAVVQLDEGTFLTLDPAADIDLTFNNTLLEGSRGAGENIGSGAINFVAGAGVTIEGFTTLAPAQGNIFPAFMWHYVTTSLVRITIAQPKIDQVEVVTGSSPITLDCNNQPERMFYGDADISGPKTFVLANDDPTLVIGMDQTLSNLAAVLTFPSDFTMGAHETGRWNNTTKAFTPTVTGTYHFSASWNPHTSKWELLVTPNVFQ